MNPAYYEHGSQFYTVPAGTAGKYHINQCTGTDYPLISYRKKYWPYQRNPAVSVGKWIPGKESDRETPKKNSHEFSELFTQSCCTWPEPKPLRLLPLPTTQTHRSQPLKTQLTQPNHRTNTQPMNKNPATVSPSSAYAQTKPTDSKTNRPIKKYNKTHKSISMKR